MAYNSPRVHQIGVVFGLTLILDKKSGRFSSHCHLNSRLLHYACNVGSELQPLTKLGQALAKQSPLAC